MDTVLQVLLSGLVLGVIYALVASGLSLIWGTMNFANFAHGEFLMVSMYLGYWTYKLIGMDPMFSFPFIGLCLALIGMLFYRTIIRWLIDAPDLIQILGTFGAAILLQGLAQFLWSPDYRAVEEPLLTGSVRIAGAFIGKPQLFVGIMSLVVIGLLYLIINKTELGFAIQATGQDRFAATLVGLNHDLMFMYTWGFGLGCLGIAGALLSMYLYIFPQVGTLFGVISFVVVALGGLGSIQGALIGGCIIGLTEVLGGTLTLPSLKHVFPFALYLPVLLFRPKGIMEYARDNPLHLTLERGANSSMRHSIWRVCFFGIVALIVILYPMIFRNPFYQHLAILTFLYALVATGWNVLGGLAGQVSFGHAVFFGAGAYTVTLIQAKFHLSPWVGLLAGVVLAVVLGLMIGYPTLGLRGRYFTIATMVLGEIAALLVMNTPAIGGAAGMYVPVAAQGLANFQWHTSKVPYYYATLLLLVIALVAVDFLRKSKCGYYLRALGAQPDAAEAIGIDIRRYKIIACCVSAVIAAIGGAFYANYVLFVDPDSVLPMAKSTMFVVITLVGGIGTLWGPLLGALVIIPASEITRVMLSGSGRALDLIVYGAILVLTTLFAPKGIMGIVERIAGKLKSIRPC